MSLQLCSFIQYDDDDDDDEHDARQDAPRVHKAKGAHGRAAVHAIGHKCKTGGFAYLERTKGKGAAIAAYQNALRKHKRG